MSDTPPDWKPQSPEVQQDQRAAYDTMRATCPVAFSEFSQWTLFRHADVKRVLLDDESFSNRVSQHLSVPNGMDGQLHRQYRRMIEPYFSSERVAAFKPKCQALAAELAYAVCTHAHVEAMKYFAEPFAARLQCLFMGWDESLAPVLLNWAKRNSQAVLAGDKPKLGALAQEFEALVAQELDKRKDLTWQDVTTELLQERIQGQPLSHEEIASILRNWTVGEVGTIAASIGILLHFLASHQQLQSQLRQNPELLWPACDEILRLHNPLTDNRRRTTCPVSLGGRELPADARLTLNWVAANRDPEAFPHADQFMLTRDASQNLLYGMGAHLCPGAALARMELVVAVRAWFEHSERFVLDNKDPAVLALYPMSGYQRLGLNVQSRQG